MPIIIEHLSHTYSLGAPFAVPALRDISAAIEDGERVALIGPTGSGKSTLLQHLNGLLRPTAGRVWINGADLAAPATDLRALRRQVGLAFQFPEHQLFEETVARDVAFGLRGLKLSPEETQARVAEALALLGLDPPAYMERSPFTLSGGEQRRVALAGVLAMRPSILLLDEPAAGLDPRGRRELLELIDRLCARRRLTLLLVSHHMDEVARLAQRVLVLAQGRLVMDDGIRAIFARREELLALGLELPAAAELIYQIKARGARIDGAALTPAEAEEAIYQFWCRREREKTN